MEIFVTASGSLLVRTKDGHCVVPVGRRKLGLAHEFAANVQQSIAFLFRTAEGQEFWVTSDENGDETLDALKTQKLGYLSLSRIPLGSFTKLIQEFGIAVMGTKPPLGFLIAIGKIAPIMSEKALDVLQSNNHYRSTIADLMFRKGLGGIKALVYVEREKGERAEIPEWVSTRHLSKSWFGCETLDDAVTVKLASPRAIVIELEDAQA
jgi:hypothetical protein